MDLEKIHELIQKLNDTQGILYAVLKKVGGKVVLSKEEWEAVEPGCYIEVQPDEDGTVAVTTGKLADNVHMIGEGRR